MPRHRVPGPYNFRSILVNRLRVQGLIVFDFIDKYPEAYKQLGTWYKEGKLTFREDVREGGLDAFPDVLKLLYTGGNFRQIDPQGLGHGIRSGARDLPAAIFAVQELHRAAADRMVVDNQPRQAWRTLRLTASGRNLTFDPPMVMFAANRYPDGRVKDTVQNAQATGLVCLGTWRRGSCATRSTYPPWRLLPMRTSSAMPVSPRPKAFTAPCRA